MLKELALLTSAVAAGIALLFLTGNHLYYGGRNFISWGYPLPWHYQYDTLSASSPMFGVFFGTINWLAFGEDLVFWFALSLAVVEGSSHVAVPYLKRKLEVRRSRQITSSALATDQIQTPNGTA